MKYNIYLLKFNNYFNRKVIKLNSLSDYLHKTGTTYDYVLSDLLNCNFAYNDGVNSSLIVNENYVLQEPDYMLVVERNSDGTNSNNFSRWFILDSQLIRGNQYQFTVKRDICVDYNDLLFSSKFFIERGYVNDSSNLVFNDEGQKYSQIKTSQTVLEDETGGPWIIGYTPRKTGKSSDTTIKANLYSDSWDEAVNGIENWAYYAYTDGRWIRDDNTACPYMGRWQFPVYNNVNGNKGYQMLYLGIDYKNRVATSEMYSNVMPLDDPNYTYQTGVKAADLTSTKYNLYKTATNLWIESHPNYANAVQFLDCGWSSKTISNLRGRGTASYNTMLGLWRTLLHVDNSLYNTFVNQLQGYRIKDTQTNKIWQVTVSQELNYDNGYAYTEGDIAYVNLWNNLYNDIPGSVSNSSWGSATLYGTGTPGYQTTLVLYFNLNQAKITLSEVAQCQTVFPKDDDNNNIVYRQHLVDAPYDMFCIPYSEKVQIYDASGQTPITTTPSKQAGLAIAQEFATQLGKEVIYDLQILPYAPQFVRSLFSPNFGGKLVITQLNNTQVRPITIGGVPVNYVFYCNTCNLENIILKDPSTHQPYKIEVENYKRSYNLDMWRLISPNQASIFEFSPAMNGGVNSFIMSATYKPYSPYIRVRPNFGRMYGNTDWKDGRGLILAGDFSLPIVTDAWTEYELQNKNYQKIFDREIQSLDLQDEIGKQTDWFKGISGVLTGGIGGAIGGSVAGGGIGGMVGAGLGSILSGVGGALDITNNQRSRDDAWTKAHAIFNYNLQNIQALPNTLSNVGCLTVDNVLIPILEYYTASDDEKEAFEEKMQWYGMSVQKVGYIGTYLNTSEDKETFIKGYLLRLESVDDGPVYNESEADNHLAQALSDEITKGIYINGYIQSTQGE